MTMNKKSVILASLAVLMVLLSVFCINHYKKEPTAFPDTCINPGIVLEIVNFDLDTKTLTVRIINDTENVVYCGNIFQLLYYNGASWKEAKYRFSSHSTTLETYPIKPGESKEKIIVLTSKYLIDPSKQYYVTMNISERLPSGGYEEYKYGILLDLS